MEVCAPKGSRGRSESPLVAPAGAKFLRNRTIQLLRKIKPITQQCICALCAKQGGFPYD